MEVLSICGSFAAASTQVGRLPRWSDRAIVTGEDSLSDQVRALTSGRGADLLIDTIGGDVLTSGLLALADGGRAMMVGEIGGFDTRIDAGVLLAHRLTVTGCFMGPVMSASATRSLINDLLHAAAEGRFKVPIDATYSLSDINEAHRSAESSAKFGRVIVYPQNP